VEPTGEVWVTEPAREAIETFRFDAKRARLVRTGAISVPSGPESLVVDPARGVAYTNTFGDTTVVVGLRSRAVAARWPNGCRGARGIALDTERGWVFVGCEEGAAVALDAAHGGKTLGTARTGAGVDGIDFSPRLSHLYVPAADAAALSILGVSARGELTPLGTVPTAPGAHCAAADDRANVYVCDPRRGALLVLRDPHASSR
jgi:DNA-binding beta-propeller fold protein YncE